MEEPRVQTQVQDVPAPAQEQVEKSDGMWQKFAEPRGWAAKWDGSALAGAEARQSKSTPTK